MPPHKKAGLCAQGKQMNCLIDIDGTLLNGSEPLPGAVDFIKKLNSQRADYLLMTNSIKSVEVQQARYRKQNY